MKRLLSVATVFMCLFASASQAEDSKTLVSPAHRISADDSQWVRLAQRLRDQTSVLADFTEERWFPFKRTPTLLKGEARLMAGRGLSLHYTSPEDQIVLIDQRGILLRTHEGTNAPPSDPRATAANTALLQVLQLDLPGLAKSFDLYGQLAGENWTLVLVPRAAALKATLGQITVGGMGAQVRKIEMRRSEKQRIQIVLEPARPPVPFTPEEERRYFR